MSPPFLQLHLGQTTPRERINALPLSLLSLTRCEAIAIGAGADLSSRGRGVLQRPAGVGARDILGGCAFPDRKV